MDKLFSINFSRLDALVLATLLGFVLAAYTMSHSVGWFALEDALIALGFVIIALLLVNRRRVLNELSILQEKVAHLDRRTDRFFHQTEHLISINASLSHGRYPFPKTGGWVPAPDYLHFLMTRLYRHKPAFVLEAGSGVSTYLIATMLDHLGDGQVIALEHKKTLRTRPPNCSKPPACSTAPTSYMPPSVRTRSMGIHTRGTISPTFICRGLSNSLW